MLKPLDVQEILAEHDSFWTDQKGQMREFRRLYMTRFWSTETPVFDSIMRTEVPKAFAVVEGYLGSLFAKNPSCYVQADIRGRGNPEVAQAVANQYLLDVRNQLEDATRLALIYPCSFLKLAPVESTDPLKRVECAALPPWEVIVDATASSWDAQRWTGHVYLMPLEEASERYTRRKSSFASRSYSKWIDSADSTGRTSAEAAGEPSVNQWVRVVEIYDLRADKLLVWSPDFSNGTKFLFTGVKVQVGTLEDDATDVTEEQEKRELVHERTGIPYKSASGRPVVPIIPMYLSRDPDTPLRGYSLIGRSVDQFREINVMRTYQQQGVRRMARQWLVRAGFMSEDGAAKIAQGLDGEMIEVDLPPGTTLDGNMMPIPNPPIPADIALYAQTVENDINEAGILAPFTRGEVTKSTATEQNLLAAYTSSQIGRMARTRDGVISSVAEVYNVMLSVILGDEGEALSLPAPVGPTVLSAEDLTGDFTYWAVDQGSTPMSDLVKQNNLERLAPMLVQMGVPPDVVLEEIVRTYNLPESFVPAARPAPPEAPPGPELQEVPEAAPPLPFPSQEGI